MACGQPRPPLRAAHTIAQAGTEKRPFQPNKESGDGSVGVGMRMARSLALFHISVTPLAGADIETLKRAPSVAQRERVERKPDLLQQIREVVAIRHTRDAA